MRLFALVPVKGFGSAKSRLGGALESAERAQFAQALCEHVLKELLRHPALAGVVVLTNAPEVSELALGLGADVLQDPTESATSLGGLVDRGLTELSRRGASHALVLMGDLPRLSQGSLSALAERLAAGAAVIVADRHGVATNALGLPLPATGLTAFGSGDSLRLHLLRFPELERVSDEAIEFDVDEPADLAELERQTG